MGAPGSNLETGTASWGRANGPQSPRSYPLLQRAIRSLTVLLPFIATDSSASNMTRICKACGSPLPNTARLQAKFCSTRCRMKAAGEKRKAERRSASPRACVHCGEPLTTQRAGATYCSRSCKTMASARRRMDPLGIGKHGPLLSEGPTLDKLFEVKIAPVEAQILLAAREAVMVGRTAGHDVNARDNRYLDSILRAKLKPESLERAERVLGGQFPDDFAEFKAVRARQAEANKFRKYGGALAARRLHNLGLVDLGHTAFNQRAVRRTALGEEYVKRAHNRLADLAARAPDVARPLGDDEPVAWDAVWDYDYAELYGPTIDKVEVDKERGSIRAKRREEKRGFYLLWGDLSRAFNADPASFDDHMFDMLCSLARKATKRENADWFINRYKRTRAELRAEVEASTKSETAAQTDDGG